MEPKQTWWPVDSCNPMPVTRQPKMHNARHTRTPPIKLNDPSVTAYNYCAETEPSDACFGSEPDSKSTSGRPERRCYAASHNHIRAFC